MRRALLAASSALAIAGCGGGGDERGANGPTPGGAPVVDMNDQNAFVPKTITVSVGDKVTWRNVGAVAHTVTTDKSKAAKPSNASVPAGVTAWDSGLIGGGKSYSYTFRKPGTYRYFCIPHEGVGMVGTVVVK
jgi:plastocyanin